MDVYAVETLLSLLIVFLIICILRGALELLTRLRSWQQTQQRQGEGPATASDEKGRGGGSPPS